MYIPASIENTTHFPLNPDLLRELNFRYLQDGNNLFLHAKHHFNLSPFLRPNISSSPVLPIQTIPSFNLNNNTIKNEHVSSPIKKTNKWCSAHVRISWMIYQQQQQHNSLDQIQNTKPILLPSSIDVPLPSPFNYRSQLNHSDSFIRVTPTLNNPFGSLGSLFSPKPTQIDRKFIPAINHDRSRFHRNIRSLPSKHDHISSKKRSSAPFISSNHYRSRSPHVLNKNSSIEQQYFLPSSTRTNTYLPIISPTTAALIQHEYFLNALHLSTANNNAKIARRNLKGSI